MAKNRQPFAVVSDYQTLIDAFRRRKDELEITHLTLDDLTGLPKGYSGKLFGRSSVRALGPLSFGLVLRALGLRIIVEIDKENSRKYAEKAEKSKIKITHAVRRALIGKDTIERVLPTIVRNMQEHSRQAYMQNRTPAERRQIARNAARARWARANGQATLGEAATPSA